MDVSLHKRALGRLGASGVQHHQASQKPTYGPVTSELAGIGSACDRFLTSRHLGTYGQNRGRALGVLFNGFVGRRNGRQRTAAHQKNVFLRLVLILIALHYIARQRLNAGCSLTLMRCLLESIRKADQPAFTERRAAKRDAVRRWLRVEARREGRRRRTQRGDWGRRIHVKASWNRD